MRKLTVCAILALAPLRVWASVDLSAHVPDPETYRSTIAPSAVFERTQAVLKHFGVPDEQDYSSSFDDLQGKPDLRDIRNAWKSMDLGGAFIDFVDLPESFSPGALFKVFQDRLGKQIEDYSVALGSEDADRQVRPLFEEHLTRAALNNSSATPLAGLKIALDPGHMGGDYWDSITGKFVKDASGNKLSEGVLNLQMALLLEQEFTKMGAQVMLTHRTFAPVTTLPYETYDLHEYALKNLRESTLDAWFLKLIDSAPAGPALYQAFSDSADFKELFSEKKRWDYFVQGYDLDARADMINKFNPDLTLILHLDANDASSSTSGLNSGVDGTKMYVPGAFSVDEVSSREDRMYIGRHLLDTRTHQASIAFSRAIANAIHDKLNVPYDGAYPGHSIEVEDGVQTRNLGVQRPLISHPSVYFEGLYYNDPKEFAALRQGTHPLTIGGENVPYSDRLKQLEEAVRDATVGFVQSYGE